MNDIQKHLAERQSRELADQVIRVVNPATPRLFPNNPTCLVTSFASRADVPAHTSFVKMSRTVELNLKKIGLNEPVSLKLLQGKWWVANVDASADNPHIEAGGCATTVIASSEQLIQRYVDVYCEVVQGPYGSRDEIDGI